MVKPVFKKVWRWSWLLTLPVSIFFLFWALETGAGYHTMFVKYVTGLEPASLRPFGRFQFHRMLWVIGGRLLPEKYLHDNGVDTINLFISESDIKKLDSNLPYSGRDLVEGNLLYKDGGYNKVKVRYRGDYPWHWAYAKKSLRVKTSKKYLYDGMRTFNLIIPKTDELLNEYISLSLARKMGLLAPYVKMADVSINGKHSGIYILTEQLGEQFLRRNGRLPGDLYVGDIVLRDRYSEAINNVLSNPEYWGKASINNHFPPEYREPMIKLCRLINLADDEENSRKLLDMLDVEQWARFAAYVTILQTLHYDDIHNWRLYFDPAKGKFEPAVWDPMGWGKNWQWILRKTDNRAGVITNILFERLHRNHRFLLAKQRAVEAFFSAGLDKGLQEEIKNTASRLEPYIRQDRNMSDFSETGYPSIVSPAQALKAVNGFGKRVAGDVAVTRLAFLAPPRAQYELDRKTGRLHLQVNGFAPVEALEVECGGPIRGVSGGTLEYAADGKDHEKDISPYVSCSGRVLSVKAPFFARGDTRMAVNITLVDALFIPMPASYFIRINGLNMKDVRSVRACYAGGKSVELKRAESLQAMPVDGNFEVAPTERVRKNLVWQGDVMIDGVREVDDDLTLRPGTTVRFAANASLILNGRLTALGTKDRPVRFIPAREGQKPWGSLVLKGRGCDGSRLADCVFSKGSSVTYGMVEYTAMFSVHDAQGVEVADCAFSDSQVSDDMVHNVYSDVSYRGCRFERAKSDAIDCDIGKVKVDNCVFVGSGNDCLDLMTTRAVVTNCGFHNAGDKGISMGEDSRVFAYNDTFDHCVFGVQAKDDSRAVLYNVEFVGNKTAVDAYKKNWQYGDGGHAFLAKARVVDNGLAFTADKDSSIKVYDSYVTGELTRGMVKKKRLRIDRTNDAEKGYENKARVDKDFWDEAFDDEFFMPYRRLVNPSVRGRA